MRVPSTLATAFGAPFEKLISEFANENDLLTDPDMIRSPRFLARSIVPHIKKLSTLFNRMDPELQKQNTGLAPYWKESSNPEHLRLAYFLYFMPCNLFRIASIWSELARLGFKWSAGEVLRAIEFGAGPASGATGIAAAEKNLPPFQQTGIPHSGNWALLEQDKAMLSLGKAWAERYFAELNLPEWGTRPFHRKLDLNQGFLPRSAPRFNLWVMSYFLNELSGDDTDASAPLARKLIESWDRHLEDEGVVIIAEPALKLQSRKLLALRRELLKQKASGKAPWLQLLLPCLGEQSCGALADEEDWCHEEVTWWRPPYFRTLDQMAELDRKTLPFSYLVIVKTHRSVEEVLPALKNSPVGKRLRLVSPAHSEGRELEFFVCGREGKRRARFRPPLTGKPSVTSEPQKTAELPLEANPQSLAETPQDSSDPNRPERGDILLNPEIRGDVNSTRIVATGGIG